MDSPDITGWRRRRKTFQKKRLSGPEQEALVWSARDPIRRQNAKRGAISHQDEAARLYCLHEDAAGDPTYGGWWLESAAEEYRAAREGLYTALGLPHRLMDEP